MKKLIIFSLLLTFYVSQSQTHTMIAMVLEDGKEQDYLAYEKNWNKVAQQMVEDDLITQWSVWKRTPRAGDENWAQYYVFRRTSKEQDEKQNPESWTKSVNKVFKGRSQRSIDRMLSSEGIVKENRSRTFKFVAATGWRGLEWKIGDKAYFHFMTQKNEDFINYENAVWKPIANQQILDGYRKFWGLGEIIDTNDNTKALKSSTTHIAFNFMTDKKDMPVMDMPSDFIAQKAWEGLSNSRDMLPAEELTLIYSTF